MSDETPPIETPFEQHDRTYRPDWVPSAGHRLHRTGIHFDAVRIQGVRGELVAAELILAAGSEILAGPVLCEAVGFRWTYFLLPPGTAIGYRWPRDVQRFGAGRRHVAYIGIPALTGNTWPLRWYAPPTPAAPFVAPKLLHDVAHDHTGPVILEPGDDRPRLVGRDTSDPRDP